MKSKFTSLAAVAVLGAGLAISGQAFGQQSDQAGFTQEEKAQIGAVIREYLLENPELLAEVQVALQRKRDEQQKLVQRETIENSAELIFASAGDPIIGNPDASVTIVEFFDYNCGYCRRALNDMNAMVEADPDVKFVLKEFPILGENSQKAHVVAVAFQKLMPEKYPEFHRQLLGGRGADEDIAIRIAVELGADEGELREAMRDEAILTAFSQTYDLANRLGITGTPSYVVGDEVVFGALGQAVLSQKVANIRECEKATC